MKVVLITGCSSGLGRALARKFHSRDYRVFASARNPKSIQDLQQEGISTVSLDVTSTESVQQAVAAVVRDAGRIDFLICNAGVLTIGPIAELSVAEIQASMDANVTGPIRCAQAVAPIMAKQKSGIIALTGSVSATLTTPFAGAYSASKAAAQCMFTALRMELAPLGIQVTTYEAGSFKSSLSNNTGLDVSKYGSDKSLYSRVTQQMQTRANMSQSSKGCMPTEAVAEQIVRKLCRQQGPPALFRVAGNALFLKFLGLVQIFVWPAFMDRLLRKKFGLAGLW